MTNEELEIFIEKYISVRVRVGKPEYDSKLVRQVMLATAFYVREEQRKIDTNKACEAFCIESKCRNRVNLACRQTCEKLKCFRESLEDKE